jgi:hypothetical protein
MHLELAVKFNQHSIVIQNVLTVVALRGAETRWSDGLLGNYSSEKSQEITHNPHSSTSGTLNPENPNTFNEKQVSQTCFARKKT